MADSVNNRGEVCAGVLIIRTLLFGVHIRAPIFGNPHKWQGLACKQLGRQTQDERAGRHSVLGDDALLCLGHGCLDSTWEFLQTGSLSIGYII